MSPIYIHELRQEGNTFMVEDRYALQMQDITVEFPGVLANDHVSIDCKKGEVLGLLGENGAGKTTLMNGILPPQVRFY